MEANIGTICVSAEGEQGGTRRATPHSPPLLHLHPYIGWLQNSIVQISRNTKFRQNQFEFREISQTLGKISRNTKLNILQNYENKHFCSHLTPTQSAVCCTNSRLLKQSFAARQCYFEMKAIYALQFSILSSLILWGYTQIRRPLETKLVHQLFTAVLGSQAQGPEPTPGLYKGGSGRIRRYCYGLRQAKA